MFALTSLVVLHLTEWALNDAEPIRAAAGWTIVLATLTRYEAWPIIAAAMVASAFAKWRRGTGFAAVVREMSWLALYPAGAVVFFLLMSRITTSHWFVTGGFFVPDPELQGRPRAVWDVLAVRGYRLDLDWGLVYGPEWHFLGKANPVSTVLAVGSRVSVFPRGKVM